jgi:hypothetical protein
LKLVKQRVNFKGAHCPSFDAYLKCREYSTFKAESGVPLDVKVDGEDVSERISKDVQF